jgi:cytochrome P450
MRCAPGLAGPPGHPLVGHWWQFERDRLGFVAGCHRRYGDTVPLHIVRPGLLIRDPRDIQHVLVDREDRYKKSDRVVGRSGRRMFSRGLLTGEIPAQRVRRRLVQPHFHRRVLGAFVDVMRELADDMLDSWAGRVVDVTSEMDRFSEQVLIRALAGELDERTAERISQANRARRRLINDAFAGIFPLPHLLPTPANWRYRAATRWLGRALHDLVAAARGGRLDPRAMLSLMAEYETTEGRRLGDDEVVDEMLELLTAGYETTREVLTWSVYLMARHPEEALRVREQVRSTVGDRAIGADAVPGLTRADMFLSESLRLYPPTWMFIRVAVGDDRLPSGAAVRAGAKIYLCQYTSHRNPAYFPDPDRFDPDRFLPERQKARPRFAYFPFGGGPRVCVAEQLVRVEGAVLLASVARRFDLALADDRTIDPVGAITLRPRQPIIVTARPI